MRNVLPIAVVALVLGLTASSTPARAQAGDVKNPNTCKDIWSEIGLPTRKAGAAGHITMVCHLGYLTGHNDSNKTPDWVIEHLTPKIVSGSGTREDQDFQFDPALPEKARPMPPDYEGSGFDKGHNAPAADFHGDQKFLDDTFFFSNAVPQVGLGFNRSIWRSLETLVRKLVTGNRPSLYVITGPINQSSKPIKIKSTMDVCRLNLELAVPDRESICPENHKNKNATCSAGVAVPAAMFKIVYDPASQSAFAVVFQNMDHSGEYKSGHGTDYIQAHRVGVATIETLTGYSFFSALPDRKQRQIKANCTDVKLH